jgi:hypothetical protein
VAEFWRDVEQAILAGDADQVIALCLPLDEHARAGLAAPAEALAREHIYPMESPVVQAAQTALLCVGPPPPAKRDERGLLRHPAHEHLEVVVLSRPRAWRDAWAQAVTGHAHSSTAPTWRTLRAVVRAGACVKPQGDGYPRLLLQAMQCVADGVRCEPRDVAVELREDPEVLNEDIWTAFRIAADKGHLNPAFERALVELAAEEAISRDRLIDETIAAIRRTDDPGVARRLMAFHDRVLKPTPRQLESRQGEYLRWLESDRDALVGFALGNVMRLSRAADVDDRHLLSLLEPLVALRSQTHAKRAVLLAGQVVGRAPGLRAAGLPVVADGLAHGSAEVQLAALKVLERHADDLDPAKLRRFVDLVDPALARRLAQLAGTEPEMGSLLTPVAVPPPSVVDPAHVPRLLRSREIHLVAAVDELVDLAALLLEGLDNADEAERFVEGVSRLCDQPVPSGRRTALLRRAKRRSDPVAVLVRAWLRWDGEYPPRFGSTGPTNALGQRLTAVARRIMEGRADVLLSAPTHRGGFLDPLVLATRLERAEVVEDHDLAQALLRLPALGRAAGFERLANVSGEPGEIVQALLNNNIRIPPGTTLSAAWDSASVLTAPDQVALEVQAPGDPWFGFSGGPEAPSSPARHLAAFEPLTGVPSADGPLLQRWLASVWPGRRDLYFGTVLRTLRTWRTPIVNIRQRQERLSAAFGVMGQNDEPLGPFALELLALGLLAPGDTRLSAAHVVADASATRRLEPGALGRSIAGEALRSGAVPNRLGAALQDVAELGALQALEVQQVLEATLAALGEQQPSLVSAIDLLRRLAVDADARISDQAARAWLGRLTPNSKSGRLGRAALAVTGDGAARSVSAAAVAREAMRERTERLGR